MVARPGPGVSETWRVRIDDAAAPLLDQIAREHVEQIVTWAGAHAADHGVRVIDERVRVWRSVEEPEDHEVVVELSVTGDAAAAQHLWDDASVRLGELIEAQPTPAAQRLALAVHRR